MSADNNHGPHAPNNQAQKDDFPRATEVKVEPKGDSGLSGTDKDLVERMYINYFPLMMSVAAKYKRPPFDPEDIVHDAWLKIIRNIPHVRDLNHNTMMAYICRAVVNVGIDLYRRGKTEKKYIDRDVDLNTVDPRVSYIDEEQIYLREILSQVFEKLPEKDQFLLIAKEILGLTNEETASHLCCQPGSTRMMRSRARRSARELYLQFDEAG